MKKSLDVIIFIGFLILIAIANNNFLEINLSKHKEDVKFASSLNVDRIVYTSEYAKNIFGYGGTIPMAIGVDKNNIIKDIKILKNAETPDFLNQVLSSGLLKNWIGKSINISEDIKVDAISGATMSSQAIIKSLNATTSPKTIKKEFDYKNLTKSLCILFIGLIALFSFFAPKKSKKIRPLILATSVFVLGVWQGQMLSVAKISAWFLYGVPDIYQWSLIFILLTSVIIPIFTGKNFYCYYLCPFGATQELVGQTFNIKKKHLFKWLIHLRMIILISCLILLILGLTGYVANIEPFSAFKPQYAPLSSLVIFIFSLILSIFINRPWCKYFCPCGALLDLFKKN
ncbi:MAG: 4Fe-4S binding protein [Alphaproteobacteria bacterium]